MQVTRQYVAPADMAVKQGADVTLQYEGLQGLGGQRGEQVWKELENPAGLTRDARTTKAPSTNRFKPSMRRCRTTSMTPSSRCSSLSFLLSCGRVVKVQTVNISTD
mmetsp:Transcript_8838/g.19709  ORF Transcript_8838/g.19709 Transcript_8838/m.19709 type:complete len:106 (-) Transcript_8838:632-949(-)